MSKTLHKTGVGQRPLPGQLKIPAGRGPVERSFSKASITYQLQKVDCGKRRCRRCRGGPSHGPYWYAYWWSKDRTRSKYIGKTLPRDLGDVDQGEAE